MGSPLCLPIEANSPASAKGVIVNRCKLIIALSVIAVILISRAGVSAKAEGSAFATNQNGLTYGSASDVATSDLEPDLIAVVTTDGRDGYVYKEDLDEASAPAFSQDEALAKMRKKDSLSPEDAMISIPAYDVDGTTIIGEFLVG